MAFCERVTSNLVVALKVLLDCVQFGILKFQKSSGGHHKNIQITTLSATHDERD